VENLEEKIMINECTTKHLILVFKDIRKYLTGGENTLEIKGSGVGVVS